jgi:hypothetical protein
MNTTPLPSPEALAAMTAFLANESARGSRGITYMNYRDLMQRGGVQHEAGKSPRYTPRVRGGDTFCRSPKAKYQQRAKKSR